MLFQPGAYDKKRNAVLQGGGTAGTYGLRLQMFRRCEELREIAILTPECHPDHHAK